MAFKSLLLGVALAGVAAGMFSNQRRRRLALASHGTPGSSGLAERERHGADDNLARDLASPSDTGRGTPGLSSGTGMGESSVAGSTAGTSDDLLSPGGAPGLGPTPGRSL